MALFYSETAGGFLDDAIHAEDSIPSDAVAISADRHAELLAAQSAGCSIVADSQGRPRIARPPLDARRAAAVRRVKRHAAARIEKIAPIWRQLNDQRTPSEEGNARFVAIDAIRAASDAIEAKIADLSSAALDALDVANHPLWPAE